MKIEKQVPGRGILVVCEKNHKTYTILTEYFDHIEEIPKQILPVDDYSEQMHASNISDTLVFLVFFFSSYILIIILHSCSKTGFQKNFYKITW